VSGVEWSSERHPERPMPVSSSMVAFPPWPPCDLNLCNLRNLWMFFLRGLRVLRIHRPQCSDMAACEGARRRIIVFSVDPPCPPCDYGPKAGRPSRILAEKSKALSAACAFALIDDRCLSSAKGSRLSKPPRS